MRWKLPDSWNNYKLCYVEDDTAFFTSNFKDQWGDDWDDAPYCCNAGAPYEDYKLIKIRYDCGLRTAREADTYRPYSAEEYFSVKQINNKEFWWMNTWDEKDPLYAEATPQQFVDYINKHNGNVYFMDKNLKDIFIENIKDIKDNLALGLTSEDKELREISEFINNLPK